MILRRTALSLRAVVTSLLLSACLWFGGSASIPLYEMGLSIFALFCLLVVAWSGTSPKIDGPPRWFIVAFLSLVAIQLMPLPNVIWNGLPQAHFTESLLPNPQLESMWKSLSIVPDDTLYSLIAAAPALFILWLVSGLIQSEKHFIANLMVLSVLCQALIGIAQAAGVLKFSIYDYHHQKVAIGLFASRNHFADLILMGTSLMFAVRQSWSLKHGGLVSEMFFHTLLLVFLLAMIGSASRAGLALFLLLVVISYALSISRNHRFIFIATAVLLAAVIWTNLELLPQTGIVKTTFARFEITDDGRWDIWKNSWVVAHSYWPFGAGIGVFQQAYEQGEPLQSVNMPYINDAHNEYLQIIIETGMALFLFLISFIVWVIINKVKVITDEFLIFSPIFIGAIILHSAVDYPLRVIAVSTFVAFYCGLCWRPARN